MRQWYAKTIKLTNLRLDENNPRHPRFPDQRSILLQ